MAKKNGLVQCLTYLTTEQKAFLEEWSMKTGISAAHMMRTGLDLYIKEWKPKLEKIAGDKK